MLTPMCIPLETKASPKGFLPGNLSKNEYNNLENEHKTFQIFVIRNIHVVVYNKMVYRPISDRLLP